ncbi:hypothetical protein SCATT_24160 [Streptantibioticus cattleyicolor NRRL 8057 = DSM 46488]|uniref:Uncharacterized protein n=1 Tax=Streptantibioticus cattleyicolor (strain ATCC 35852 / DSM 46488 / JCM 4925 / NBRC 14057 / NRRL 8057) TaxID=1003195 RepID=G8WS27_STREN|nr:hypothetical protein SCATT_24160 [Streptantibioticus cattleyicolor NRRL 8057 = DSM 46488]
MHDPHGARGEGHGDRGHRRPPPGPAARLGGEYGEHRHAVHPVVRPADRADQQRGDRGAQHPPGLQAAPGGEDGDGEAGDGGERVGDEPDRAGGGGVQQPGEEPLEGLVVDDPDLADPFGLEDPVGPEVAAGVGEDQPAQQYRSGERGRRGGRRTYPSGQQQVDGEEPGGQLDAGRDADGDALAAGAVRPAEVPQHQAGEGKVDLAEGERLEDRFEPYAEGDGEDDADRAQRGAARPAGEPERQVGQEPQQHRVGLGDREPQHVQRRPGGRDEQDRGERRVGGGQPPLGDPQVVQAVAAGRGLALGPVDQRVGELEAHRQADPGVRGERGRQHHGGQQQRPARRGGERHAQRRLTLGGVAAVAHGCCEGHGSTPLDHHPSPAATLPGGGVAPHGAGRRTGSCRRCAGPVSAGRRRRGRPGRGAPRAAGPRRRRRRRGRRRGRRCRRRRRWRAWCCRAGAGGGRAGRGPRGRWRRPGRRWRCCPGAGEVSWLPCLHGRFSPRWRTSGRRMTRRSPRVVPRAGRAPTAEVAVP